MATVGDALVVPPPPPEGVHRILAARAADVDRRVLEAFAQTLAGRMGTGAALLAVGGYGRKELFPQADVDLLLLTMTDAMTPPREALADFLQLLWDGGLRPSNSVHSVAECATEHTDNVELTISLLDRRFLAGDQAVYQALEERFRLFLSKRGGAVAQQLAGLAEGRRAKFQNTIYHLEPNIKDAPGGLRDLQTTRWLMQIDPHEGIPPLEAAMAFLGGVRIRLHELTGRDQNVLSFESQDALAEQPAALMREYYRHARVVDRAVRQAIANTN